MINKTYARNKRAKFDYEFIENYTAGIVLTGPETKSIRIGLASLKGAYVIINEKHEAWLINCHIATYPHSNINANYEPDQARKLLLNKSEIDKLKQYRSNHNVLVAVSLVAAGPKIKLILAAGKPKKRTDKRQTIRGRDIERETGRRFKK